MLTDTVLRYFLFMPTCTDYENRLCPVVCAYPEIFHSRRHT